jgi:hypothetical protein
MSLEYIILLEFDEVLIHKNKKNIFCLSFRTERV